MFDHQTLVQGAVDHHNLCDSSTGAGPSSIHWQEKMLWMSLLKTVFWHNDHNLWVSDRFTNQRHSEDTEELPQDLCRHRTRSQL